MSDYKYVSQITCPVCHDSFSVVIPRSSHVCIYNTTASSVQALADRAGPNRPFSCPECRCDIDTRLPQNDPNLLSLRLYVATAFFINRLKDLPLHSLMETADRKVEALCQQCSGGSSDGFCRHCVEFICGDCMKLHKKLKVFAGHGAGGISLLDLTLDRSGFPQHCPTCSCHDYYAADR